MKIRLINKQLYKSKSALVKVAVQVNGKFGQYSSHRWKNPNAAFDVLENDLKRMGVDDINKITFKDKRNGDALNKDDVMKEYKSKGGNRTLQDFVKENYQIGTKIGNIKEGDVRKVKAQEEKVPSKYQPVLNPELFELHIDEKTLKKPELKLQEFNGYHEVNNYEKGKWREKLVLPEMGPSEGDVKRENAIKNRDMMLDYIDKVVEDALKEGEHPYLIREAANGLIARFENETDPYAWDGSSDLTGFNKIFILKRWWDQPQYIDMAKKKEEPITFLHEEISKLKNERLKKRIERENEEAKEQYKKDLETYENALELVKAGLRPPKINGVDRKKPMTFEQADTGSTNPNYRLPDASKLGFKTNCQSGVAVFEARLRGYDLEVVGNKGDPTMETLSYTPELIWIDPKTGEAPKTLDILVDTPKELLRELTKEIKPNERYTLDFAWKGVLGEKADGHIITLYKNSAGDLIAYDPQSDIIYPKEQIMYYLDVSYFKNPRMPTDNRPHRLLRIDDKLLNPLYFDNVSIPKAKPTKGLKSEIGDDIKRKPKENNNISQLGTAIDNALKGKNIPKKFKSLVLKSLNRLGDEGGNTAAFNNSLTAAKHNADALYNAKKQSEEVTDKKENLDAIFMQLKYGGLTLEQMLNSPMYRDNALLLLMFLTEDEELMELAKQMF